MITVIESGHQQTVTKDVNMMVVYDDQHVMLAAMWTRDDGTIAMTRAGEDDFAQLCKSLGLKTNTAVIKV